MTPPLHRQTEPFPDRQFHQGQLSADRAAYPAPGYGTAGYISASAPHGSTPSRSGPIGGEAAAYTASSIRKPLGWYIVNWLFFWPTAIYSMVAHWSKIDAAARAGDVRIAQLHARMVRDQAIIAVCLVVGAVIAYSIFFIIMLQLSVDYSNTH